MFEAGCTRINTVIQQYDKVLCDLCIWTTVVGRHGANIFRNCERIEPKHIKTHLLICCHKFTRSRKQKKKGEQRGQKAAHSGSTTASNVKGNKMHACRSLTSYMLKFPSLLVNLSLSMFLCSGSCLKVQSGLVQPVVLQKKHSFLNGLRQRRETIFYFKIRLEGMNVTHNTNKLIRTQ